MKATNKKTWSFFEIEILKNKYNSLGGVGCHELLPDRSIKSIGKKARELGLKFCNYTKWSDDEIKLLINVWPKATMKELQTSFPNRSYSMLVQKAGELGIKSKTSRKRKGDLNFFDNLTSESAYWWGFYLADGHLAKNGSFVITLSENDIDHLENLAIKLNTSLHVNPKKKQVTLRIQDKAFGEKWLKILNIDPNSPKTYTPPDISCFYGYYKEIIIGLIDGDGHIRYNTKEKNCSIELFITWQPILQMFSDFLLINYDISSSVKKTNKGRYVRMVIQNKSNMNKLKKLSSGLPILERKWNNIN